MVEEEPVAKDEEGEGQDITGYMGAGLLVLLAAGVLGGG